MCHGLGTIDEIWGLYHGSVERGQRHVHPDDYEAFSELHPYGLLFQLVGRDGEYSLLRYRDKTYRVLPELFVPATSMFSRIQRLLPRWLRPRMLSVRPHRDFGELVQVWHRGELITAPICDIKWHFKRSHPYYLLTIDGKPYRRWYFDEDFV